MSNKLSALIVDDDSMIRKLHKMLVSMHGFSAEVTENGKQAVDLFKSGVIFDLVLMDMEMPIMDGIQATKELRAMGVDAMIVGVTTRGKDSEKQAFMVAGLNDCFEKPLKPDAVASLYEKLRNKN